MNVAAAPRQRNLHHPPAGDSSLAGTIDLHGLRKADAIGRLTTFLSDVTKWKAKKKRRGGGTTGWGGGCGGGPVWVCVVTGSGSHSESGPVIRTAVSNLLAKRGMNYAANRGGGSFTVDAASGIELSDDPRTRYVDTKVLLKQNSSCSAPDLVNPALRTGRGTATASSLPSSRRGSVASDDSSTVMAVATPSPSEVAADDAVLHHARSASLAALTRQNSQRQREGRDLERAVSESNLLRERDEEGRRELRSALARSAEDRGGASEADTAAAKDDVERAIRESVAQAEMEAAEREAMARVAAAANGGGADRGGGGDDDDGAVQRAIRDSLDLAARQEQDASADGDPDEEFRRAMEASLAADAAAGGGTDVAGDDAVERAIRESLATAASETYERVSSSRNTTNEDEMVERALRESLTLTTTSGSQTSTEDEDSQYRDDRYRDDPYRDRRKVAATAVAVEERRRIVQEALRRSTLDAGTQEWVPDDDGGDVVLYTPGGSGSSAAAAATVVAAPLRYHAK